jgi:hypothetical protein
LLQYFQFSYASCQNILIYKQFLLISNAHLLVFVVGGVSLDCWLFSLQLHTCHISHKYHFWVCKKKNWIPQQKSFRRNSRSSVANIKALIIQPIHVWNAEIWIKLLPVFMGTWSSSFHVLETCWNMLISCFFQELLDGSDVFLCHLNGRFHLHNFFFSPQ